MTTGLSALSEYRIERQTGDMKVYLRYYVELPFPAAEVDRTIASLPGELLDRAAREANLRGCLMLGSPTSVRKRDLGAADLCVRLSAPLIANAVIRRSIEWLAVRGDLSHPVLHGDLEVAELGPSRTQLAVSAYYEPDNASLAADHLAVQRVCESTLKAFLDQLAGHLSELLGIGSAAVGLRQLTRHPAEAASGRLEVTRGPLAPSAS